MYNFVPTTTSSLLHMATVTFQECDTLAQHARYMLTCVQILACTLAWHARVHAKKLVPEFSESFYAPAKERPQLSKAHAL